MHPKQSRAQYRGGAHLSPRRRADATGRHVHQCTGRAADYRDGRPGKDRGRTVTWRSGLESPGV